MRKEMNLYKKHQDEKKKKTSLNKTGTYIFGFFAFSLIIGAYGAKLFFDYSSLKAENERLKEYVGRADTAQKYEIANKVSVEINNMGDLKNALTEINGIFEAKQSIGDTILSEISSALPAGVSIKKLEAEAALVKVTFISTTEIGSSNYAKALEGKSLIKEVRYSGYKYVLSENNYEGTLVLVLKGGF